MGKPGNNTDTVMADAVRGHVLANFLLAQVREHFSDYGPADVLFGLTIAVAVVAKRASSVEGSVIGLLRKCLKAPLHFIPAPTDGGSHAAN